jgi:hypothetical protein
MALVDLQAGIDEDLDPSRAREWMGKIDRACRECQPTGQMALILQQVRAELSKVAG